MCFSGVDFSCLNCKHGIQCCMNGFPMEGVSCICSNDTTGNDTCVKSCIKLNGAHSVNRISDYVFSQALYSDFWEDNSLASYVSVVNNNVGVNVVTLNSRIDSTKEGDESQAHGSVMSLDNHKQCLNETTTVVNICWGICHVNRCSICKTLSLSSDWMSLIDVHTAIRASGVPNFKGCRIQIPSNFRFQYWEDMLEDYSDRQIIDLLRFGFPINISVSEEEIGHSSYVYNHSGAVSFPAAIEEYLHKEILKGAVLGPFRGNPFGHNCVISPLNSVPKRIPQDG